MHKVFYMKLKNNQGSEIKFSDNQSRWKDPVSTRWIEYLVDQLTTIPTHFVFPLLYYLSSSSPGTVFMFTFAESGFIGMCLEWFLYGNISVLFDITCTLAKEVQLFPGLGLYSGIFAIYLQCLLSKESRTGNMITFCILCILYVLSTATVVSDLLNTLLQVSNNSICKNIIFFTSYADAYKFTIAPTSNWLTVNFISP